MRILLVRPPMTGLFSLTRQVEHEPLELEYLASALRAAGHQPVLFDRHTQPGGLVSMLRRVRPQVVCVTGYIIQQEEMKRYARAIKRFNPRIWVVLGGSHVELNYKEFYNSEADYLYHISGLQPLCRLMEHIEQAKGEEPRDIPGLCYRAKGGWVCTPKITCHPQDLPLPDRRAFYRYKGRYRYLTFRPLALVKSAYSCPYQCNFCYCTNLNGGVHRSRSAQSLVDEIAALQCPNVHIVDDDFLVDVAFLKEFARLMREKGVRKKLMVYGRADFIARNPQLMAELAQVGLALIMVGLEAVADSELADYDKKTTIRHNEECVRVLEETGIICAGLFIVRPDMTKADFDKLYRWVVQHRGNLTATVSVLTPMPGSSAYAKAGPLLSNNPKKQDLAHCLLPPTHMSLPRFYYEYYKLNIKLFAATRKHPVYSALGPADLLYPLGSAVRKLWRKVVV